MRQRMIGFFNLYEFAVWQTLQDPWNAILVHEGRNTAIDLQSWLDELRNDLLKSEQVMPMLGDHRQIVTDCEKG